MIQGTLLSLTTSGSRKIDVFMISGFVVYRCHGNIDFSKITIITNFSLNPVSGENARHFDEGKSLKSRLKIIGMAIKKLSRNSLKQKHRQ